MNDQGYKMHLKGSWTLNYDNIHIVFAIEFHNSFNHLTENNCYFTENFQTVR